MERREFLKLTLSFTAAAGAIVATAAAAQAAPMLQRAEAGTAPPVSPDTAAKTEADDKGAADELSSRGRHHHHHHRHHHRRHWRHHRHHRHHY